MYVDGAWLFSSAYALDDTQLKQSFQGGSTINPADVRGVTGSYNTSNAMLTSGFVGGGVGVAPIVVGVVLYAIRPKSPPKTSAMSTHSTPSTSKVLWTE